MAALGCLTGRSCVASPMCSPPSGRLIVRPRAFFAHGLQPARPGVADVECLGQFYYPTAPAPLSLTLRFFHTFSAGGIHLFCWSEPYVIRFFSHPIFFMIGATRIWS